MEYVKVIFPEQRIVILDGDPGGNTSYVLLVEKGTHRFQLDGPQNYKPKWRQLVVKDTTFARPMEVSFDIIEGLGANSRETVEVVTPVEKEFEDQFYSVFISYSHEDKAFADMLHDRLHGQGIRSWLDKHQMLPGDDLHEGIDRGIRLWDKVLLCASESSLTSWWVDGEINRALQKEAQIMKDRGKKVLALIPLNLDGFLFSADYQSGMKPGITRRVAANFVGWKKDHAIFDRELEKVIRALRTEDGGRERPPESRL